MHTQSVLFNIFASLALVSATMVIISANPIHSVIFLILVFCNATGLLLLLKLEFLGMMFLIIYVGAIAVLFLFIVMMLNIKLNEINENWLRYLPIGGIIGVIFLTELALVLGFLSTPISGLFEFAPNTAFFVPETDVGSLGNFFPDQKSWSALIDPVTNIQSLGYLIYTYYFYHFVVASLILLIAMIGAIVLTMYKRKNASKKQLIFKQVFQSFENAINCADTVSRKTQIVSPSH
uniref:NADH-ubiquinone oxidoreductase chain 6 n=1 Tax=Marophrys sp. SRT127 TaxID=2488311 RepID=A0A455RGG1_9EUKA|nr:NADH dehydrogenase subunit 6 [Marophrys sp. SRT127]